MCLIVMMIVFNDCLWLFLIEFWLSLMIVFDSYDDCWLFFMVVLLVYDDWLLWMFIIIAFDGCFTWLFILINVFDCLILYWLLIITYLSSFLTLSVFNFLDISNLLHWVSFGFGSLYFCFALGCFLIALDIPLCYLSLDVFNTWLIPLRMIGYYVNDCFYFDYYMI